MARAGRLLSVDVVSGELFRAEDERAIEGYAMKGAGMQFVIIGFTNEMGFRVFAFEGVGADRVRIEYKVKADLTLIRKYGIRLQELPLLCRAILEQRIGSDAQRTFIYTEADMSLRADFCAARTAEAKRKVPRRPRSETLGNAWRGMPVG